MWGIYIGYNKWSAARGHADRHIVLSHGDSWKVASVGRIILKDNKVTTLARLGENNYFVDIKPRAILNDTT